MGDSPRWRCTRPESPRRSGKFTAPSGCSPSWGSNRAQTLRLHRERVVRAQVVLLSRREMGVDNGLKILPARGLARQVLVGVAERRATCLDNIRPATIQLESHPVQE